MRENPRLRLFASEGLGEGLYWRSALTGRGRLGLEVLAQLQVQAQTQSRLLID
jgi:hypothetical protein